jgi:hypothetical protein
MGPKSIFVSENGYRPGDRELESIERPAPQSSMARRNSPPNGAAIAIGRLRTARI